MSFPVDTDNPSFPVVNTAPGGRVIPPQAHAALESDRAAWVWSRRVLLSTWIDGDAGGDLVRIRARLSPVPTGSARFLRFAVFGSRSSGTHPLRATVGTAEMEVDVGGLGYTVDSAEVLEQGEVVDVVISDLMPDPSGTVSAQVVVYEDVGSVDGEPPVPPPPPAQLLLSGLDYSTHTYEGDTIVEIKGGFDFVQYTGDPLDVPLAVVAGGGAGGFRQGGGGGAGGVLFDAEYTLAPGAYAVEVGDGGPISTEQAPGRPAGEGSEGGDGGDSRFGADVAIGGGGGASRSTPVNGADGGSGGGGAGTGSGGTGVSGQGNDGGDGNPQLSNSAGGGGGAGEPGGDAVDTTNQDDNAAGDGGDGVDLSAHFGTAVGESGWFGGGGGGAAAGTFTPGDRFGAGGQGGGGDGSDDGDVAGENGQPNTGGGGGGNRAGGDNPPGNGGSGVVLLRLPPTVTIVDEPGPGALVLSGLDFDTHTVGGDPVVEIKGGTGLVAWLGGSVDVPLAVAGQGGAGGNAGVYNGGAGAGGLIYDTAYTLTSGVHAVDIGERVFTAAAQDGDDTTFAALTAIGGGGGGRAQSVIFPFSRGSDGGSGGGGGENNTAGRRTPGEGVIGQGHDGGAGATATNPDRAGGGGGGAGGPGDDAGAVNGGDTARGGDGGPGVDVSASFGTDVGDDGWLCGGGGGASRDPADGLGGQGGQGGGGNGGVRDDTTRLPSTPGKPNTGGGGGGGFSSESATPDVIGGSGVVLIRLPAGTTIIDADA